MTINQQWDDFMFDELKIYQDKIIPELRKKQSEGKEILPRPTDTFRAFKECELDDIKVVIIGQDPYHTVIGDTPMANGLCFSSGVEGKTPPSLRRLLKELEDDCYPNHFDPERLEMTDSEAWGTRQAQQGVLLLNTSLTVDRGDAGSHARLWQDFTNSLIKKLDSEKKSLVWLLMGGHAKGYSTLIKNGTTIELGHPSPLNQKVPFMGTKPFTQINNLLTEAGKPPIQW